MKRNMRTPVTPPLRAFSSAIVGLAALVAAPAAFAQWAEESVTLQPGWNAVYLPIAPEPTQLDGLLADTPQIQSVWRWNQRFSPVDFDFDPGKPFRPADAWLRWFPDGHPSRALRNLYELQGNVGHLIHVATNAAAFTWKVTGRPLLPAADWFEFQLNLMGLAVDPDNIPTFNTYFADVPEIGVLPDVDDGEIYAINTKAEGVQVLQPARTKPARNQAYWILCLEKTSYAGPLVISITPNINGVLDFGTTGVEGTLAIANVLTNRAVTVRLTPMASAAPPAGQPAIAGQPPLGYYGVSGTNSAAWRAWTAPLQQEIAAGGTWSLPVCVWRNAIMTNTAGVYQGLIEVKEAGGLIRCQVPVRATVEE